MKEHLVQEEQTTEMRCREALNQALREEMERDERVFVIGEDVAFFGGSFKITEGLLAQFGEKRVIDTPISEAAIVGCAVGAALAGLRPVAELMTINFALLAMDQIVNHAAKIRYMFGGQATVPLVIRCPQGGGHQLGAQHSQNLEAYFLHCPGIRVVIPSTPDDAKGLLKSAIRDDNPVMFIEHEGLYGEKGEVNQSPDHLVPIGKAKIVREGKDVSIISYSKMALFSLDSASELEKKGIDAEVVDVRSLNPLDIETLIKSVRKTSRAIIVHEAWKTGGAGAEIAAELQERAFDYLDAPITRVAGKDVPSPYNRHLEAASLPQKQDIIEAVLKLLGKDRKNETG
jgi:pyruvate dehydrogenase E1 component beta subunit